MENMLLYLVKNISSYLYRKDLFHNINVGYIDNTYKGYGCTKKNMVQILGYTKVDFSEEVTISTLSSNNYLSYIWWYFDL